MDIRKKRLSKNRTFNLCKEDILLIRLEHINIIE